MQTLSRIERSAGVDSLARNTNDGHHSQPVIDGSEKMAGCFLGGGQPVFTARAHQNLRVRSAATVLGCRVGADRALVT